MDALATELGTNKATIYYYYRSKSDILFDVVTARLQGVSDAVADLPESLPLDDYLRALITISVEHSTQYPNETAVYFQESPWLEQALSASQLAEIRRHEHGFRDAVNRTVATGQSTNHYRNVEQVPVRHLIVGMLGHLPSWYQTDGDLSLAQVADRFGTVVLEGLIAPSENDGVASHHPPSPLC